jgi:hypothetical protein
MRTTDVMSLLKSDILNGYHGIQCLSMCCGGGARVSLEAKTATLSTYGGMTLRWPHVLLCQIRDVLMESGFEPCVSNVRLLFVLPYSNATGTGVTSVSLLDT